MSGQDCERALSSFLPALSACVSCSRWLRPPPTSPRVQISDCVSSGLRLPLCSGRRRSGKPVSARRGNEREELRRSRQLIRRAARHSEHGPASPRPHMPRWDSTSFVTPNLPKSTSINTSGSFYRQDSVYLAENIPANQCGLCFHLKGEGRFFPCVI